MQFKCSCGKMLNVPDTLAGKSGRCPGCQKVFKVPGAPAAAAPAGKVVFDCTCGKKLSAPLAAAGKKIACPACSAEILVPRPKGAAPQAPAAAKPAAAPAHLALDETPRPPEPPPPAKRNANNDEGLGTYGVAKPRCPNCKAEMESGAQFCIECGTHMVTGSRVPPHTMFQPDKKSPFANMKPKQIIIFIVAALAVLAAAGFLVWRLR